MSIINNESVTIVIVSFKSRIKILNFIKKIPKTLKVIIIENSNDEKLKNEIEKNYNNIEIYIKDNNGVSSSINYAVKKIKTDYFLQISPDIDFNFEDIKLFKKEAEKLKNNFAALGPRFINVNESSHKQSNPINEVASIHSIHGSVMFINRKVFNSLDGFDENFFLYFEETDYCKRGRKKGIKSYQINKIKAKNQGRSVTISKEEEKVIKNILGWHFIWSKFYYFKKHYGKIISIILFIPVITRTIFKLLINYLMKNTNNYEKYKFRFNGLRASINGEKSSLRPKL